MRATALIIAASLTLGPSANAQTKDFVFLLPGSATCARLLPLEIIHGKGRDRASSGQVQAYEEVKGWLQGYFTAANIFDGRGDGDFTRACVQLSRMIAAANCAPARKFLASLS